MVSATFPLLSLLAYFSVISLSKDFEKMKVLWDESFHISSFRRSDGGRGRGAAQWLRETESVHFRPTVTRTTQYVNPIVPFRPACSLHVPTLSICEGELEAPIPELFVGGYLAAGQVKEIRGFRFLMAKQKWHLLQEFRLPYIPPWVLYSN
jgi:hypothetical protein